MIESSTSINFFDKIHIESLYETLYNYSIIIAFEYAENLKTIFDFDEFFHY